MVNSPSQRNLEQGQTVLLRSVLNDLERIESALLKVALAVHASNTIGFFAKATVVRDDVSGLDLAGEQTTSKRVVDNDIDLVLAAERDELGFDSAS